VAQRFYATILLLLGLAGAVIGALVLTDYFVVRGSVEPRGQRVFMSMALKALTLSALHVLILVPVGVLGLRRPKG
jgi:purine-cytosine permease-like protein